MRNLEKMKGVLGMMKDVMEEELNPKIEKTFNLRDEWKELHQRLYEEYEILEKQEAKVATLKKAFWSKVEADLELWGRDFRYNPETKEIELIQEEE